MTILGENFMTTENSANLPELQDSEDLPTLPNGVSIPQYTIVDQTSLDGNKIVDLADPEYGMDAVNLRTLHRVVNDLPLGLNEAQVREILEEQEHHHRGRGVAVRTVYEGTLAQLQALGTTIAGATIYPGNGEHDLESCGVLLLSRAANGIALLPESGIYALNQAGQYQRAIHFRAAERFEPGLMIWADAVDSRYEVLDGGIDVPGGFSLSIRLIPRPGETVGEGVLHSRPTGPDSSAIRLEYSERFSETNGELDLSDDVKAAIEAVPGLITDQANTAAQVTVQQGQINTLTQTDQAHQQAINALENSLKEIRITFTDGALSEIFDGPESPLTVNLLTTVRAKLAIYQINHSLNRQSVKMTFQKMTPDPNSEEYTGMWLECQTGMQRLDPNTAVVNVPLSGVYVLVLSKH
jgi:hypothetical protein